MLEHRVGALARGELSAYINMSWKIKCCVSALGHGARYMHEGNLPDLRTEVLWFRLDYIIIGVS